KSRSSSMASWSSTMWRSTTISTNPNRSPPPVPSSFSSIIAPTESQGSCGLGTFTSRIFPTNRTSQNSFLVPTLRVGTHDGTLRVPKLLMTRTRYRVGENNCPHFLTCTVVGWMPVFTRPETVDIIYDSWRFLQENGRLVIYGYVILENHLHL